ncbi:hypothetical protein D6C97_08422, partial [Aureobasidium pullulans]
GPKERNEAAVRHCAGKDSFITLCVNVEAILECLRGMEAVDTRIRKIRDDFCSIAMELYVIHVTQSCKIGKGTTEGGVSKLFSRDLSDYMENYVRNIETHHAIIREIFDDHIDLISKNKSAQFTSEQAPKYNTIRSQTPCSTLSHLLTPSSISSAANDGMQKGNKSPSSVERTT